MSSTSPTRTWALPSPAGPCGARGARRHQDQAVALAELAALYGLADQQRHDRLGHGPGRQTGVELT